MQGVPINMQRIPAGSVSEFLMALHADAAEIVRKVNRSFSHEAAGTTIPGRSSPAPDAKPKRKPPTLMRPGEKPPISAVPTQPQ